jgi:histidine triad (HIT) family protein
MENCIFCKIASGEIPAEKVYEDEHTFAFLDLKPVNPGHTLVIPKKHADNLYEIDDASLAATAITARNIAIAIKKALGAEGVNVHMNNGRAAGQVVFHLHMHVIPRYQKDGRELWHGNESNYKNSTEIAEKIKSALH